VTPDRRIAPISCHRPVGPVALVRETRQRFRERQDGLDMPLGHHQRDDTAQATLAEQAGLLSQAGEVANFLKALGHDGRLTILCHLRTGPKSVTELENLLSSRQAVVSQQLARLRLEGLVSARREGQAIYYSLLDPKVGEVIGLLAKLFCKQG
jgi:ArsR family transcriptional regulator